MSRTAQSRKASGDQPPIDRCISSGRAKTPDPTMAFTPMQRMSNRFRRLRRPVDTCAGWDSDCVVNVRTLANPAEGEKTARHAGERTRLAAPRSP
jgi:hypothetical protein